MLPEAHTDIYDNNNNNNNNNNIIIIIINGNDDGVLDKLNSVWNTYNHRGLASILRFRTPGHISGAVGAMDSCFALFRARLHDSTVGPLYNENRVQGSFDAKFC